MNIEQYLALISLSFSALSLVCMIAHFHMLFNKMANFNERRKAYVFYVGACAFMFNILSCCAIGHGGLYLWISVIAWMFMLRTFAYQSNMANRLVRVAKGTLSPREKKAFDNLDKQAQEYLAWHGQRIIEECGG